MRGLFSTDIMVRRWNAKHNFYELDLLKQIQQRERKGLYLDIGANLGNHSVFFANFCPCDMLVAVEAHSTIHSVAQTNIRAHCHGVLWACHNLAVMHESGRLCEVGKIDHLNVGSTTCELNGANDDVRSTTIDDLCDPDGLTVAVIKMDIEGSEALAVRGGLDTIERDHPLMVMEAETAQQVQQLDDLLKPFNYKRCWRTQKNPASHIWEAQ